MQNADVHIRWEVWIGELNHPYQQLPPQSPRLCWRFNACFDARADAETEGDWYQAHGYEHVEIRCRTTRYQPRRHITTG